MSFTKQIYQYNFAINKAYNSFNNGIDYKYINKASGRVVLNPFNFCINSLILLYVFVPMFAFKVSIVVNIFIKIALALVVISVCYELMYLVEYRYKTCPVTKVFAYPLIALNYLTTKSCDKTKLNRVCLAVEELPMKLESSNNLIPTRQVVLEVKQALAEAQLDGDEANALICDTLNIARTQLIAKQGFTKQEYSKIIKVLDKRKKRMPLNKILKTQSFYGLDFFINESVLAPRPETELLVEQAINHINSLELNSPKVLDLCTGSGAIAICVAKHTKAKVTAIDVSGAAIKVATKNAQTHNTNIRFIKSDMLKALKPTDKFDIIISNPPYISTSAIKNLDDEVKLYDPILALDGGADGLKFYREIADLAPMFLKRNGSIMLEIGYDQQQSVTDILKDNFTNIQTIQDYNGLPRIIVATKKG